MKIWDRGIDGIDVEQDFKRRWTPVNVVEKLWDP